MKTTTRDITPILEQIFKITQDIKPQDPKLYEHLRAVMNKQGVHYPKAVPVYCVGETVDKLMFVSEGFVTCSAENAKKQIKVLSLYEVGEIKCFPDFLEQTPSEFVIEAAAGTFVAFLTFAQLQTVYRLFPEVKELTALMITRNARNELRLKKLLSVKGIALAEAFYKRYPKLIVSGAFLSNEKIASYLGIGVSTLIEYKNRLIDSGRLCYPDDKRQVNRRNGAGSVAYKV